MRFGWHVLCRGLILDAVLVSGGLRKVTEARDGCGMIPSAVIAGGHSTCPPKATSMMPKRKQIGNTTANTSADFRKVLESLAA